MTGLLRRAREIPRVVTALAYSAKLSRTARAVKAEKLTYLSPAKLARLEYEANAVLAENVAGNLLEFGVALGGSAIAIAKICTPARQFHGFDVFGMIPEPASDKDDTRSKQRYDVIRSGRSEGIDGSLYYGYRDNLLEEVRESFFRHGIDGRCVTLHKGLFEETWPGCETGDIAFAHIDCDWYDPVRFCLAALADKISPGGVIVLDDYHDYGGCKTAVDEFLDGRPGFAFENGPNVILRKIAQD